MTSLTERYHHPAWWTGVATAAGYGLILVLLTVLLFVVPFLLFWLG